MAEIPIRNYDAENSQKCPAREGSDGDDTHPVHAVFSPRHSDAYYIQWCTACDNVVLRLENEREYMEWSTDCVTPQNDTEDN